MSAEGVSAPNCVRVLTAGREALPFLVSLEDRDLAASSRFYIVGGRSGRPAVCRYQILPDGSTCCVRLALEIFDRMLPGLRPKGGRVVAFANGDCSDLRRENLVLAIRRALPEPSSPTNVYRRQRRGGPVWVACVTTGEAGSRRRISKSFHSENDAIAWRDEKRSLADPLIVAVSKPPPPVWAETLDPPPPPRGRAWPRAAPS